MGLRQEEQTMSTRREVSGKYRMEVTVSELEVQLRIALAERDVAREIAERRVWESLNWKAELGAAESQLRQRNKALHWIVTNSPDEASRKAAAAALTEQP
jgi:hypothetical protein